MALVAQRWCVLRSVLGELMVLIGIGLVIGLAATAGATKYIATLLYGVKANDPWILVVTAEILGLSAVTAGFLQARRASRLDPMRTLREE